MSRRLPRLSIWLVCAAAVAAAGAGCAKAQASVEPIIPALAVPPPPPRVLPPLEGERVNAAAPTPSEPPSTPRQPARPRAEAQRAVGNGSARAESRGEGGSAPQADGGSSGEGEASQAAPSLHLASPGDAASEQHTRRRLAQAAQDLQRIDYRQLNTDAKAQYDIAKRFITLAEQAIVDRNLLYARTLADKAATIAGVLQRR